MNESKDDEKTDNTLQWHCLQHKNKDACTSECYLQDIFTLFGKRHTLSILRFLLLEETLRFNEIAKKIGGSSKTITDRLRELEACGLIRRETFNEIPVRVEYSLTKLGRDLEDILERTSIWAKTWLKK